MSELLILKKLLTESLELVAFSYACIFVVEVLRDSDLVYNDSVVVNLTKRICLFQIVPADFII